MNCAIKNIVISGTAGVLGGELVRKFAADPETTVYALSSNAAKQPADFAAFPNIRTAENWELFNGSIPLDEIDCFIHAAFSRSQSGSDLASSIAFAREVFECAAGRVKRFVNISTQGLYSGASPDPHKEDEIVNPSNLYAMAKYACEELSDVIFSDSATSATNVRLASLIGKKYPAHLVAKITRAALANHVITVAGGAQRFSFLDLDDAVDGIYTLAVSSTPWRRIYNLGAAGGTTLKEVAETVAQTVKEKTNSDVAIEFKESNDMHTISLDMSAMLQDFNWHARKSVADTVAEIIAASETV